jgi:putative 2OG-Fe(II) oxygenase
MNVFPLIDTYAKSGFVGVRGLLHADDLQTLQTECSQLLDQSSASKKMVDQFLTTKRWQSLCWTNPTEATICFDILGQSVALDQQIDKLLSHPVVQDILETTLGSGYRLWWSIIRRANPNAKALRLHQDLPGQTTLQVLLDNIPTASGTTILIPRSLHWPHVINAFPFVMPHYFPFPRLSQSLVGQAGDIWLFSPTVWHGRVINCALPKTVLMLSFVPINADYPHRMPPVSVFEKLGPHIQSVLMPNPSHPSQLPATETLQRLLTGDYAKSKSIFWKLIEGIAMVMMKVLSSWRLLKQK